MASKSPRRPLEVKPAEWRGEELLPHGKSLKTFVLKLNLRTIPTATAHRVWVGAAHSHRRQPN
jgi:hypothetical protein